MEIHLCVRRSLDWANETRVAAEVLPRFRSRFDVWNATFEMSYAAFRLRLRSIAEANLARVDGAQLSRLGEVPPGALVVPVDDDDWFAPELATRIRRALASDRRGGERAGVYWIREVVAPPRRRRPFHRWIRPTRQRGPYTCSTNNYAVRSELPAAAELAENHLRASDFFDSERHRVLRIPRILAIQNRSLASQTALGWRRPAIDRDWLLGRFEAYRRFYAGWTLRRELRWAQPCVDAMAALMADLSVRPAPGARGAVRGEERELRGGPGGRAGSPAA